MTQMQSDAPTSQSGDPAGIGGELPEQPPYLQGIDFEGLSTENCVKFLNAHRWAHLCIAAAIEETKKPASPHYAYWLDGSRDDTPAYQKRKATIARMLQAMHSNMGSEMGKPKFRYQYSAAPPMKKDGKTPNYDAIAKSGQASILLYDPALSDDSLISRLKTSKGNEIVGNQAAEWMRTCVIAHEVAHNAGANIEEERYIFAECHNLAQDNPELSVTNAQNIALFVMACDTPSPSYRDTEFNGIWRHGVGPHLQGASPAGVAAAGIHDEIDLASRQAAASPRPIRSDLLMAVYQDADTRQRGALWFKLMLTRSIFNASTVQDWGHRWTEQRPMRFEDGRNCCSYQDETWDRPAPALVGLSKGSNRFFRCAYVDMETRCLCIVQSDVITDAMTMAADFTSVRWHAIPGSAIFKQLDRCSVKYGPAIAQFRDDFYCLYVTEAGQLKCLRQTGSGPFEDVNLVYPMKYKSDRQQFSSAPSLVVLDGGLSCSIRMSIDGSEHANLPISFDGKYWNRSSGDWNPTAIPAASVRSTALWKSSAGPILIVSAKSVEKKSDTFFYWTCREKDGNPAGPWSRRRPTMVNARTSPLLVAQGTTLHAFYQTHSRDIRHLYAVDPIEPPFPVFPDEPAPEDQKQHM